MEPKVMNFIYQATNLVASGKFNSEVEHCLAGAIERELLAINPHSGMEKRQPSKCTGLASELA